MTPESRPRRPRLRRGEADWGSREFGVDAISDRAGAPRPASVGWLTLTCPVASACTLVSDLRRPDVDG